MAKKFRIQNPSIKREMAEHRTAMNTPLRPYSDNLSRQLKAVEYARFIATRDGIELPATGAIRVDFLRVKWAGFVSPVIVARYVHFSRDVSIELPGWSFDPTAPAIDLDAAELPLAA